MGGIIERIVVPVIEFVCLRLQLGQQQQQQQTATAAIAAAAESAAVAASNMANSLASSPFFILQFQFKV